MYTIKILLLSVVFIIFSCSLTKKSLCPNGILITLEDASGLDGCTWLLKTGDDSVVHPINLDSFIHEPQHGKKYHALWESADDMFSICMAGELVRLTCISPL
ncbi:MAG TPA: hypothetical protein PKC30_06465 [Saprospiraceae bacterium]|nr:hypothetical protein [Saprospiraceae bacterium]